MAEGTHTSNSESPHLNALLSKLRPFQRTAFEFAVHGTLLSDDNGGTKTKRKYYAGKKYAASAKQGGGGEKDSTQVAGAGTGRILLGDEMGLGKTLTSLAIMLAYQQTEWPLLILCPASLRYTWPAEIEKFCPWIPSQSIHVVRGKDDVHFAVQIHRWRKQMHQAQKGSGYVQPTQPDERAGVQQKKCPIQIVIVTYSLLQNRYQIANTLRECEFECIIADESHNLKQSSSQRCQLALPLLQGSKRLVLLSGTPALNRPVELWPQLHALDAKGKMFGDGRMSYTEYTKRYCNARRTRFGWDVKGVSNSDELHRCLKTVMMRRLKNDVLHDLPAKQRSIVPVTISDKEKEQESRDTMQQLSMARQAVSEITDLDADDVAHSANWEARKLLMQAYQASGIAKAPSTTEYILDWLEGAGSTQKLVVFAHHKEVLDYIETTLAAKYKGRLGMMRIDGSVPPAERALRVKKFQSNKTVRVALLSMTAAGVGLTLTAASNIIFAELHWTPGVLAQAEDRCHRIGQASSVNVMYCICKDQEISVDMTLWNMLTRKIGSLGRVVDGQRAQLNAVEKEASANEKRQTGESEGNGASVESELSSFFASSKVSSTKQSKPIVKGTIQSFFTKQAKKDETAKGPSLVSAKKISKDIACISLLNEADQSKPSPKESSPQTVISLLDDDDDDDERKAAIGRGKMEGKQMHLDEKFICHICTFENEADVAICIMCDNPREYQSQACSTQVLQLESTSPKPQWQCNVCTYMNMSQNAYCEMCTNQKPVEHAETEGKRNIGSDDRSNNLTQPHNSQNAMSTFEEAKFDDDDEWNDEDFAAIDHMTQSHAKVSQSPNSTSESLSPDNSKKCYISQEDKFKSCEVDKTTDMLTFSVSLNSGRIALHLSSSGQPLHVNFDVCQVLTKESADNLEEAKLRRNVATAKISEEEDIAFDDGAVKQVLAALDDDAILPASLSFCSHSSKMCNELKLFVRSYLSLREVEKKVVKESGQAFASSSLRQSVAKLLVSTVTGTTERYLGGAKERAILNMRNNCASAVDKAVINGKACAWCAKPFFASSNGATYCSYGCAETGRLRRGGMYSSLRIREQLFALEHGKCTKCNIDAHSLFIKLKALHPAERLNVLLNAKWKLPQTRQATDRLLNDPQECDFWQADHKLAVAEGGGSTGLDNLRTLCTPCHSAETEKLLARLKTLPVSQKSDKHAGDGRTQMGIIDAFSMMNSGDIGQRKKRKRRRLAD